MICVEMATHADVPALAQLLEFLFQQEADFTPDRAKQCRGLALILDNPALGRLYVARLDGHVVGMVSLLMTVSTAAGALAAWLEDMVVHPDHRSRGIGSRLLQHAINAAWGMGVRRITLLTDHDNLRARQFYQHNGFRPSAMTPLRLSLGQIEGRSERS